MILVALGSNLSGIAGSPEETIEAAKAALEQRGVKVMRSSRTWMSAPVPASDQPVYRNAVIAVETALGPRTLLNLLHKIEKKFGRDRSSEARNAARTLDLDLIDYRGELIDEPGLHLPHPRMKERLFVLIPMREVAPLWIDPVSGRSIDELIESIPDAEKATQAMKIFESAAA